MNCRLSADVAKPSAVHPLVIILKQHCDCCRRQKSNNISTRTPQDRSCDCPHTPHPTAHPGCDYDSLLSGCSGASMLVDCTPTVLLLHCDAQPLPAKALADLLPLVHNLWYQLGANHRIHSQIHCHKLPIAGAVAMQDAARAARRQINRTLPRTNRPHPLHHWPSTICCSGSRLLPVVG
jgi:hypothetical protein